jgi:hypothetical protein
MQIDVTFQTFKALTSLRQHENDSLDDVIGRLLGRSSSGADSTEPAPESSSGLSIGGVFFPDGTCFRARYKGEWYHASVVNGIWTDADGKQRNSPSEAAYHVTKTNVNGWRFWEAKLPGRADWQLLDRLRVR